MGEDTKAHRDNIRKLIQYFREIRRTLISDMVEREGGPTLRLGELKSIRECNETIEQLKTAFDDERKLEASEDIEHNDPSGP
jgi:hypothetical protein